MARVDIIMPLYNKAPTVGRAIRSIQSQTMPDWHLIVIDDGSTDGGPDIVRGLADARIVLFRQDNAGPGAARNAGLARSEAACVAFLDADDEWYPWYLANALAALEASGASLAGTTYCEWPKQVDMTRYWGRRGVAAGRYELRGDEDPRRVEALVFFFHVGNSLVRRAMVGKYGGFWAKDCCHCGEDTTFFLPIVLGEPVVVLGPTAVVHHREDSALSNTFEHPLAPFMEEPQIVLERCPADKRAWAGRVIDRMVLRAVHHWARNGYQEMARKLLGRFPGVRAWPGYYWRCRLEVALSPWLPYWVRLKCATGPRVRWWFRRAGRAWGWSPRVPETAAGARGEEGRKRG